MQSTLSMPSTPSMPSKLPPPSGGVATTAHEVTIALIPSDDFGEIIDQGPPAADASGFWTALTSLTVLTVLTADKIDEVDLVGRLMSTMSNAAVRRRSNNRS
jgi:hypothetical protein